MHTLSITSEAVYFFEMPAKIRAQMAVAVLPTQTTFIMRLK